MERFYTVTKEDLWLMDKAKVSFIEFPDGIFMNKNKYTNLPIEKVPKEIVNTFMQSHIKTVFKDINEMLIANFVYEIPDLKEDDSVKFEYEIKKTTYTFDLNDGNLK